MKIVRFKKGRDIKYGVLERTTVSEARGDIFSPGGNGVPYTFTGRKFPLGEVQLLAPCLPTKIVAVGLNYRSHAQELRMQIT